MKRSFIAESLQGDPVMKGLIVRHKLKEYYGGSGDYFLDLIEIITGQQLSMKAAKSIFNRFVALYPNTATPEAILATSDETLRSIGFSFSKVKYVKNIAKEVSSSLDLKKLAQLPDEEIRKELIKIKGLGPWSVDMFLIFSLKHPDVFSVGDLGLRTAIKRLYGINRDNHKAILALAESWRPHRTLASRLLWASLD